MTISVPDIRVSGEPAARSAHPLPSLSPVIGGAGTLMDEGAPGAGSPCLVSSSGCRRRAPSSTCGDP